VRVSSEFVLYSLALPVHIRLRACEEPVAVQTPPPVLDLETRRRRSFEVGIPSEKTAFVADSLDRQQRMHLVPSVVEAVVDMFAEHHDVHSFLVTPWR
jgi:hypothetical protein